MTQHWNDYVKEKARKKIIQDEPVKRVIIERKPKKEEKPVVELKEGDEE